MFPYPVPQRRIECAVAMFAAIFTYNELAQAIALIWLAHAAFDRAIGWGLKYPDSFCNTDMGVKSLPLPNKYLS